MADTLPERACELMIIGTGISGMAAAVFAADQNIDTIQVGTAGELNYASGLLDLLAVHPIETGKTWEDPWAAMDCLSKDIPKHPYARLNTEDIKTAFSSMLDFLGQGGLSYYCEPKHNIPIITPTGILKSTYAVPETMANGIRAFREKGDCTILDFYGMKGFSGRQIVETLKSQWPSLKTKRLAFPSLSGELLPEHMAGALEFPETCQLLAEAIRPLVVDARYVGLPAILGIHYPDSIFRKLESLVERPLFEIPTMPPSITGLRLRRLFERELPNRKVQLFAQNKVLRVLSARKGDFVFEIGPEKPMFSVRAKGAVLATGRFIGKGLHADRKHISETVFGLPVTQPDNRNAWHNRSFFDRDGHKINRAGLETDHLFRPLDQDNRPVFPNLYAIGSILAHQDWKRMKCGSGLAIGTAFAAINAFKLFEGSGVFADTLRNRHSATQSRKLIYKRS